MVPDSTSPSTREAGDGEPQPRRPSRSSKRGLGLWLGRGALLLFGIALGLVVVEVALRIYSDMRYPKVMRLDDALGWRHAPHESRSYVNEDGISILTSINRFGNRGPAHPRERVAGRYRVLVLGDSFVEGTQVEESALFTTLLERSAPDLEVINAGVGGYGTVQELVYLREEGLRFEPDLVLLVFYANDLVDNGVACYPGIGPRPYAVVDDGEMTLVEDCEDDVYLEFCMPAPFRSWLFRHCYIYRSLNKNIYQRIHAERLWKLERRNAEAIDPERRLAIFFGVVGRMRVLVDERSGMLAVALIPTRDELRDGGSEELEAVVRHCEVEGMPVLSLLPALRRAQESGGRPYFARDIHLTPEGHRAVGDALAGFVADLRQ